MSIARPFVLHAVLHPAIRPPEPAGWRHRDHVRAVRAVRRERQRRFAGAGRRVLEVSDLSACRPGAVVGQLRHKHAFLVPVRAGQFV